MVAIQDVLLRALEVRVRVVSRVGLLSTLLLAGGCVHPSSPPEPGPTTIAGRVVYDSDAARGVPAVLVRAVGKSATVETDSTGSFEFAPDVEGGELVQLSFTKAGFDEFVTTLMIQAGTANTLSTAIRLAQQGQGGSGTSGNAASIVLESISANSIAVAHTGSAETAALTFQVRDLQGLPIDFAHRATLQFTLAQAPAGGASLSRDTVSTDANGRAIVALSSGTLAQAVQVRAQILGQSAFSELVPIVIHGGPPDAGHFSFAAEKTNIPGLVEFGVVDRVTAFVGDRYGNPVSGGTAVYFATTGGIIQASATTDDHGRASVDLIAAQPEPNASPALTDSAGIARVSAQTMDGNQAVIRASTLAVVFSGHTELLASPSTFDLPPNGYQDFVVTMRDFEHHNPLVAGSTVAFAASSGVVGSQASYTLPDTKDKQYTSFVFRLINSTTGPAVVAPDGSKSVIRQLADLARRPVEVTAASFDSRSGERAPMLGATASARVTITVESPNGKAALVLTGNLQ